MPLIRRTFLLASILVSQSAFAQTNAQTSAQTNVRIERVQVTPEEETATAERAVRRLQAVVRVCFERGGESHGAGRIVVRAEVERGRVTNINVTSTNGTPHADAVACTVQQLRARVRVPDDSAIRELVIPIHFEYPELTLPENAMSEARAARRRGRCLVDAANELITAIRAFERARGRARARAHARVQVARAALNACEGGLLQGVVQGQGVGAGTSTNTCPHCRNDLESAADSD